MGYRLCVDLPYRDGDGVQQAVVDQLARNVAQVNVNFVITPVAISTLDWMSELRAGQIPLAAIGWQEDIHDPYNWYRPYLLDTYTSRFNLPDDLAQKYQGLIDQGVSTIDGGARAAAYAALNAALYDDAALILVTLCVAAALRAGVSEGLAQRLEHESAAARSRVRVRIL